MVISFECDKDSIKDDIKFGANISFIDNHLTLFKGNLHQNITDLLKFFLTELRKDFQLHQSTQIKGSLFDHAHFLKMNIRLSIKGVENSFASSNYRSLSFHHV